jgi:hypothetical protein
MPMPAAPVGGERYAVSRCIRANAGCVYPLVNNLPQGKYS